MSDWKDPEPGQKDYPLHKTKLQCGCWTYQQRGSGVEIFTVIVNDSCKAGHELKIEGQGGPKTTTILEVSKRVEETKLESVPAPKLNLS